MMEPDDLDVALSIKKFTPIQKWRAFEKEILGWFIRDIPHIETLIKMEVWLFGRDPDTPNGWNNRCYQYDNDNNTNGGNDGFKRLRDHIRDNKASFISKVSFISVAGVELDLLKKAFDKYMACDKKMWSNVFLVPFEIGDGDDSLAVEYIKLSGQNSYSINIWFRYFV